jgi:hypothetical protein
VAKCEGRIFKVTGDGVLIEFASAVNAVQCAVDLQQAMATANSGQSNDRAILLRIATITPKTNGPVRIEGDFKIVARRARCLLRPRNPRPRRDG